MNLNQEVDRVKVRNISENHGYQIENNFHTLQLLVISGLGRKGSGSAEVG